MSILLINNKARSWNNVQVAIFFFISMNIAAVKGINNKNRIIFFWTFKVPWCKWCIAWNKRIKDDRNLAHFQVFFFFPNWGCLVNKLKCLEITGFFGWKVCTGLKSNFSKNILDILSEKKSKISACCSPFWR